MKYVIVYINDITVQGQHVYSLGSRVNISPIQGSTIGSITIKFVMFLVVNFIHVGNYWET